MELYVAYFYKYLHPAHAIICMPKAYMFTYISTKNLVDKPCFMLVPATNGKFNSMFFTPQIFKSFFKKKYLKMPTGIFLEQNVILMRMQNVAVDGVC